jgi:hypothetical protein
MVLTAKTVKFIMLRKAVYGMSSSIMKSKVIMFVELQNELSPLREFEVHNCSQEPRYYQPLMSGSITIQFHNSEKNLFKWKSKEFRSSKGSGTITLPTE